MLNYKHLLLFLFFVALDHGIVSSLGNGVSVLARILVASNQVSSMLDENERVALDISIASGAEIKLTGADLPSCAGVNDNVVQISGDYENVKSALFELAGKLRENFFSGTGPRGTGYIHSSYSAIPSNGPNVERSQAALTFQDWGSNIQISESLSQDL